MVNTRHSFNKDHDDGYHELNGHDHDDQIDSAIDTEERIHEEEGTCNNEDEKNAEDNINNDTKDCKSDHPKKQTTRLREAVVRLYDYPEHHPHEFQGITRRSLRSLSRDRPKRNAYEMERRSRNIKDSLGYKRYGRSFIRKSGRQPKKLFETCNEVEIQKTMERKHREMLALQEASMYDSIKRRREISGEETQDGEDSEEEEEDEEEEETEDEDEEEQSPGYSLRKTKPKTKMYQAPPLVGGRRRKVMYAGPNSPIHHIKHMRRIPQHASSPRHRGYKRRRTSSTSSSDEEAAFERRKSKSMAKSRSRCLPMNFKPDDIVGVLKSRERAHAGMPVGSSLADVDPMTIDTKITFSEIGGLDHHVRALKEMVIFPLLYTEVFEKFNITPPRGVLFHGPPGTGKTLVARALANECSNDGRKVAFFMRKGADCLSKWVGESERQLRLLFDQAYSMRPSIIFFDEIDGIAPVRSTRQDQIHSSIVSTLLALMDGLDARGEIVVIGATNRLDAIDPALRRPGRFDREFLFSLPNKKGREKIFEIHTASWQPKLSHDFLVELADKCVGYCGADIKALCTETALFALRRRYPQIYDSNKKLKLDTDEIKVSSGDFKNAMKKITPASHRSSQSPGIALPEKMKALLFNVIKKCLDTLHATFPAGKEIRDFSVVDDVDIEDDDGRNIFERGRGRPRYSSSRDSDTNSYFYSGKGRIDKNLTNRPRFLLHGDKGNGQTSYIAPALLFSMEHLTTHGLDLPSLYSNSTRTPEETVAQVFREARRTAPCIIYLPHIGVWWQSVSETTRAAFLTLLQDLPAGIPILFLATAEEQLSGLPEFVQELFSSINNEVMAVTCPDSSERHAYFKELLLEHALRREDIQKQKDNEARRQEVLREASPPRQRDLSAQESKALLQEEEAVLRELRLFLREITWKLLADRKFKEFSKPVDLEEVDDYLEIIKEPMDLSTVMTRINSHHYHSCAHFLEDIDLITNNCLEYNPDKDQFDKFIRNRACEMRDVAHSLVHDVLDPDFEKSCIEIHQARKQREYKKPVLLCDHTIKALDPNYCAFCEVMYDNKYEKEDWLECKACHQWYHERCFCKYSPRGAGRGYDDKIDAPNFIKVFPKQPKQPSNTNVSSNTSNTPNYLSQPKPSINIPDPTGSRYSRRVRGLSESSKNTEDLDQVLSRKRLKVNMNETSNSCEESVNHGSSEVVDPDAVDNDVEYEKNTTKTIEIDPCVEIQIEHLSTSDVEGVKRNLEFGNPSENNKALTDNEESEILLNKLVEYTYNHSVESLVRIHTNLSRIVLKHSADESRTDVLVELKEVIERLA